MKFRRFSFSISIFFFFSLYKYTIQYSDIYCGYIGGWRGGQEGRTDPQRWRSGQTTWSRFSGKGWIRLFDGLGGGGEPKPLEKIVYNYIQLNKRCTRTHNSSKRNKTNISVFERQNHKRREQYIFLEMRGKVLLQNLQLFYISSATIKSNHDQWP